MLGTFYRCDRCAPRARRCLRCTRDLIRDRAPWPEIGLVSLVILGTFLGHRCEFRP